MTYEIEEKDVIEYLQKLETPELINLIEKCFSVYGSEVAFAEGLLDECPENLLTKYRKIK